MRLIRILINVLKSSLFGALIGFLFVFAPILGFFFCGLFVDMLQKQAPVSTLLMTPLYALYFGYVFYFIFIPVGFLIGFANSIVKVFKHQTTTP